MDQKPFYEQSPGELSDGALQGALVAVVEARDGASAVGDAPRAGALQELACVLADERDARRGLAVAVEEAMAPMGAIAVDLPGDSPGWGVPPAA